MPAREIDLFGRSPLAEIVSLAEAVAALVHDGDSVPLEGLTHLIPLAAGHELIGRSRTSWS